MAKIFYNMQSNDSYHQFDEKMSTSFYSKHERS